MKNTFGNALSVTLFGESHGEAVGALIDGISPGIKIDLDFIAAQLSRRRPHGDISTSRIEADEFSILSGVANGFTTGTPICIVIPTKDKKSCDYSLFSSVARPGHSDYAAECKYHGFPIEEISQAVPLTAIEEPEEVYIPKVSEEEIELIARITFCEAGAECEEGKRLVIDTILNRVDSDHFPDTIEGVIFQPNQFSVVYDGSFDKSEVREDIYQLVLEELENRTDDDVIFFRAGRYHKWGTPLFQVGRHFFSSYE